MIVISKRAKPHSIATKLQLHPMSTLKQLLIEYVLALFPIGIKIGDCIGGNGGTSTTLTPQTVRGHDGNVGGHTSMETIAMSNQR